MFEARPTHRDGAETGGVGGAIGFAPEASPDKVRAVMLDRARQL